MRDAVGGNIVGVSIHHAAIHVSFSRVGATPSCPFQIPQAPIQSTPMAPSLRPSSLVGCGCLQVRTPATGNNSKHACLAVVSWRAARAGASPIPSFPFLHLPTCPSPPRPGQRSIKYLRTHRQRWTPTAARPSLSGHLVELSCFPRCSRRFQSQVDGCREVHCVIQSRASGAEPSIVVGASTEVAPLALRCEGGVRRQEGQGEEKGGALVEMHQMPACG